MEKYEVFLHDVPKVSEDGRKSLPIRPHRREEFSEPAAAAKHAAAHKDNFDRVVVIWTVEGKQKMVMRFMDGKQIEVAPEEGEEASN